MLLERLKMRLAKELAMTSITSLKSYISDGLRQNEAKFAHGQTARLIEALTKRGVPDEVLDAAALDTTAV